MEREDKSCQSLLGGLSEDDDPMPDLQYSALMSGSGDTDALGYRRTTPGDLRDIKDLRDHLAQCPYFTDEEREAHRVLMVCPKSKRYCVKAGFEPKSWVFLGGR